MSIDKDPNERKDNEQRKRAYICSRLDLSTVESLEQSVRLAVVASESVHQSNGAATSERKVMNRIKTVYETPDGRTFDTIAEAEAYLNVTELEERLRQWLLDHDTGGVNARQTEAPYILRFSLITTILC